MNVFFERSSAFFTRERGFTTRLKDGAQSDSHKTGKTGLKHDVINKGHVASIQNGGYQRCFSETSRKSDRFVLPF